MRFALEHVGLASLDPESLARWYVATLDARVIFDNRQKPPAFLMEIPGGGVVEIYPASHGMAETGYNRLRGWRHLALSVTSIEESRAVLEPRGVAFPDPIKPAGGGGHVLFFADPEGNLLHLVERPAGWNPRPAEEIFDVVNERDEVVDQRPRSEVHRLKLLHRAVHVLVFNGRGQVFLQKRSLRKDCFPGTWDSSASGHLDRGEAYDACAVRELREEIGLSVDRVPERLFRVEACADTGHEFVWVYRTLSEGPFRLQPEEVDEGAWFCPEEVDRWIASRPAEFASAFPLIWRRYRG
jgi:isopentenyl-diphosphate delta-isomerase type 1